MTNKKQSDYFLFEILKMKTSCDNMDDFKLFTEKYNKIKDLINIVDVIDQVAINKGTLFDQFTEHLDTKKKKNEYINSFNAWMDSLDRTDPILYSIFKLKEMQYNGKDKYNDINIDVLCSKLRNLNSISLKDYNLDEVVSQVVSHYPELKTLFYKEYKSKPKNNDISEKELMISIISETNALYPQKYNINGNKTVIKCETTVEKLVEKIDFLNEHLDLDIIKYELLDLVNKTPGIKNESDINLDDWNHFICKYAGKEIYHIAILNFDQILAFVDIGTDKGYTKSDLNILIKDLEDREEKFINSYEKLYDKFNDEYLDSLTRFNYLHLMKKAEENCNVVKHKVDSPIKPKTPKM